MGSHQGSKGSPWGTTGDDAAGQTGEGAGLGSVAGACSSRATMSVSAGGKGGGGGDRGGLKFSHLPGHLGERGRELRVQFG